LIPQAAREFDGRWQIVLQPVQPGQPAGG
jgi:hypothetical protein